MNSTSVATNHMEKTPKLKLPKHKCWLSNQLGVLYARKKSKDLAILTITDYSYCVKVVLDIKNKQLLTNQYGLTLPEADVEKVLKWMN